MLSVIDQTEQKFLFWENFLLTNNIHEQSSFLFAKLLNFQNDIFEIFQTFLLTKQLQQFEQVKQL
jgi:hypothetical protein